MGTALRQLRPGLKDHEVSLHAAEDLPPVEVDELQVGRVLTNLFENALEWAPPTGGIEVGAAAREGFLEAAGWASRSAKGWWRRMEARFAPRTGGAARASRSRSRSRV